MHEAILRSFDVFGSRAVVRAESVDVRRPSWASLRAGRLDALLPYPVVGNAEHNQVQTDRRKLVFDAK
ncbi:MAG: hypothetical protein ACRDRF_03930 [Pseudonocardiaceae bacterium]